MAVEREEFKFPDEVDAEKAVAEAEDTEAVVSKKRRGIRLKQDLD